MLPWINEKRGLLREAPLKLSINPEILEDGKGTGCEGRLGRKTGKEDREGRPGRKTGKEDREGRPGRKTGKEDWEEWGCVSRQGGGTRWGFLRSPHLFWAKHDGGGAAKASCNIVCPQAAMGATAHDPVRGSDEVAAYLGDEQIDIGTHPTEDDLLYDHPDFHPDEKGMTWRIMEISLDHRPPRTKDFMDAAALRSN